MVLEVIYFYFICKVENLFFLFLEVEFLVFFSWRLKVYDLCFIRCLFAL
jgi:hypothetical protein